ncbi:hypothetical protein ETAA8_70180 [Anatilimnocola aggregata]|uniref:Carboxypeptidase regulatory-like domain-containing protein n=1 Tax=Anatilimnocola aggregata TaxID=2528021 RepID=A0A517YNR0_9BACT|nr:hypothetical protein [Anatilimnocola aggregata]QDU31857.1 hypothetical protein ETAA8_70180 [Anatilimnocola aggregata]
MRGTSSWVALLFLTGTCLLGCGGSGQKAIRGEVSLDGEPVDGGSIMFVPAAAGKSGSAAIVAGKYSVPAEDDLLPGTYRVEIVWNKPTGKQIPANDPGMLTDERLQVIPDKYNTQSTLSVEITPGENEHNFLLTK